MIVADSDVLVDALRGRQPAAGRIDDELPTGSLATTAITAFELRSGIRSRRASRQVETLLAALIILPLDEDAADEAAQIRRELEVAGTPIGMAACLVAGICLSRTARLLTGHRAHFGRVPDLVLEPMDGP